MLPLCAVLCWLCSVGDGCHLSDSCACVRRYGSHCPAHAAAPPISLPCNPSHPPRGISGSGDSSSNTTTRGHSKAAASTHPELCPSRCRRLGRVCVPTHTGAARTQAQAGGWAEGELGQLDQGELRWRVYKVWHRMSRVEGEQAMAGAVGPMHHSSHRHRWSLQPVK